jgi:hypothetical protein
MSGKKEIERFGDFGSLRGFVRKSDDEEVGGFRPVTNRRRNNSVKRTSPFGEEVVVKVTRRDHDGKLRKLGGGTAIDELFKTETESVVKEQAIEHIFAEDCMSRRDEPPGNQPGRSNPSTIEYVVPEEEEQEESVEQESETDEANRVLKNRLFGASILFGSLTLLAGTAVVMRGLFGKHKSNIMNM